MTSPVKDRIIAEYEKTSDGPFAIARRIGCDLDYARYVLNLHRGGDLSFHDQHDEDHVAELIAAGGFPVAFLRRRQRKLPPAYTVRRSA